MAALELWLKQATRHLAKDSALLVRSEIREHYECAQEVAIADGATAEQADQFALTSLGDARTVNGHYRQVLLTSDEARLLRNGNSEARAFCSRRWIKWMGIALSIGTFWTALTLFFLGRIETSAEALAIFLMIGLLFVAPLLPIYTPSRSRIFRVVKYALIIGALAMVFGRDSLHMSWLLISCLWPIGWIEWRRASIRRKLPATAWPMQLFL
jgi:hypothetical protein